MQGQRSLAPGVPGWRPPTPKRIMAELCPYCGAPAGERCTGPNGLTISGFHKRRIRLAQYVPIGGNRPGSA